MSLLILFNQTSAWSVSLSDSFTLSDVRGNAMTINKSDSVVLHDELTAQNILVRNLFDSFTLSDTLVSKEVAMSFGDSFMTSEQIAKSLSKTYSENITLSDLLNKIPGKQFNETITLLESISKRYEMNKSDSLSFIDFVYSIAIDRILVILNHISTSLLLKTSQRETLNIVSSMRSETVIESDVNYDLIINSSSRKNLNIIT